MSPETFKGIIHTVVKAKGVTLKDSEESRLNALAREYSTKKIGIAQAIEALESLFASNPDIDRHDYAEIEKRLERY